MTHPAERTLPDPGRFARLQRLFHACRALPLAARRGFLARRCRGAHALRRDVERLLAWLLPGPSSVAGLAPDAPPDAWAAVGTRVGGHALLDVLGQGGTGTVYLARQAATRRRVAIKVTGSRAAPRAAARYLAVEREALARTDHANIVALLDAGTREDGSPYLVMEYVEGLPITGHCDRYRLTLPRRLRLFLQVCAAVEHAHRQGIVHRDLKPHHALVALEGGVPAVKLIDFGLAEVAGLEVTGAVRRAHGLPLGTYEYMSPEQAELPPLGVDARSDVYSLGAMLYELITGRLPFSSVRLRRAPIATVQRILREEVPRPPSERLRALGADLENVARRRRVAPGLLVREVRRLDPITLRALAKDRARRHRSVQELVGDLRRHVDRRAAGALAAESRLRAVQ